MQIQVNGDPLVLPAGTSVQALLEQLGLQGRRVAVELNHEIVTRSEHAARIMMPDDRVEIVHAIGGG